MNGTDVYAGGYEDSGTGVYWKNGAKTNVSTYGSRVSGIALSGSDVYHVGFIFDATSTSAILWKNGEKRVLSSEPAATFASITANAIVLVEK